MKITETKLRRIIREEIEADRDLEPGFDPRV